MSFKLSQNQKQRTSFMLKATLLLLMSFTLVNCSDDNPPATTDNSSVLAKPTQCTIPVATTTYDCGSGGDLVDLNKRCTVSSPENKRGFSYLCNDNGEWADELPASGSCTIPSGVSTSDCGEAGNTIASTGACIISAPANKFGFSYTCNSGQWSENAAPDGVCTIPDDVSTDECGGAGSLVANNGICTVNLPITKKNFTYKCENGSWSKDAAPAGICTIPTGVTTTQCGGADATIASDGICTIVTPANKKDFDYLCDNGTWREQTPPTGSCTIPSGVTTTQCGGADSTIASNSICTIATLPANKIGFSYKCDAGSWAEQTPPSGHCVIPEGFATEQCGGPEATVASGSDCTITTSPRPEDIGVVASCQSGNWSVK